MIIKFCRTCFVVYFYTQKYQGKFLGCENLLRNKPDSATDFCLLLHRKYARATTLSMNGKKKNSKIRPWLKMYINYASFCYGPILRYNKLGIQTK